MGKKVETDSVIKDLLTLSNEERLKVHQYIKRLQKMNAGNYQKKFNHLNIFTEDTRAFAIDLILQGEKDIYHSTTAFMKGKLQKSTDEIVEEYIERFKYERLYLANNKEKVKEVVGKIQKKNIKKKH